MKKLIIATAVALCSTFAIAQLKGSGKIIIKNFDYQNFDKIFVEDIDGKIEVEVGKSFSISITIDDNLLNLLSVIEDVNHKALTVSLLRNKNNKKYIENTKISVKITLPNIVALKNDSNAFMNVMGINGNNLKIETLDNGSVTLIGTIKNLEVKNNGNGILNAKQLIAENANIKASGNGNVYVNVGQLILVKTSGNCTVINQGKAKLENESSSSGNSRFINN